MQWKALDAAVRQLNSSPQKVLLDAGAWPHPLALHRQRFLAENFPRGTTLAPVQVGEIGIDLPVADRSEEHPSELQSLMRISYAVFCLQKKNEPHACIDKSYYLP